jgi:hypothetical protein
MPSISPSLMLRLAGALVSLLPLTAAQAQEQLPWQSPAYAGVNDAYRPPADAGYSSGGAAPGADGAYRPRGNDAYSPPLVRPLDTPRRDDSYRAEPPPPARDGGGYGEPYRAPRDTAGYDRDDDDYDDRRDRAPPPYRDDNGRPPRGGDNTFSKNEIIDKGHAFFGSVSQGLANVIEYAFKRAGRPNGYILGEDAGGAVVAGLRYGEGTLYTKDAGTHRVYWQGPSVGYDFGGEGSKAMVLVYNLRDPSEIYHRFGGVQGSAYVIGGVSIQFQKRDDVILAPIRSGVGVRLGANVGYLKYTRKPTWNPF